MAISLTPLTGHTKDILNKNNDKQQVTNDTKLQELSDLKEVTITSTRSARRVDNVPMVVSIVTAEEIHEKGARNIGEVFNGSPEITVPQQASRFSLARGSQGRGGQESINIRGLQGNNVLLLVDGIRVPNSFSFGSLSTGRGKFLDVDSFRKIEVVRGPTSSQYGSDGLSGVVNFQTFIPTDFIKGNAKKGGFSRLGYSSVDNASHTSFAYAAKNNDVQGLILGNFQLGNETKNQGSNDSTGISRSLPNPADYQNWYILSKGLLALDATSKLGITFESQNSLQNMDSLSDLGLNSGAWRRNNVISSTASDTTTRQRFSSDYDYQDPSADYFQKAHATLYSQDATVIQNSYQIQENLSWRSRNNYYIQNTKGLNLTLESNFNELVNQRLTYGFDWSASEISSKINARGSGSNVVPAPQSTYKVGGLFLQSEIEFGNVSVIPAIRYDGYSIRPEAGLIQINSGSAVSPRLGTIWNIAKEIRPFASWGTAFGAPSPDQALSSYVGTAGPIPYSSIPNPDLKPQIGRGFEVGVRGQVDTLRYLVSGYSNQYDDFISQVSTPTNPIIFQYQNLNGVKIRGIEAIADLTIAQDWKVNLGMSYSHGEQTQNGVTAPLNTIQPLRSVLGVRYDTTNWGTLLSFIWNQGKSANQVNFNGDSGGTNYQFLTPTSSVVHLTAYWKPMKNVTINLNVNNVFDSTY